MRVLKLLAIALMAALPVWAEDANPPDEPPAKPMSEEELRLKIVESQARECADLLKKRMEAAKTESERSTAINESVGGNAPAHPIIAQAVIPYLNPRPIKAGLQYGDSTINAAIGILKKQPFDETYYGVRKMIGDNRTNLSYVQKLIEVYGEIKCIKAVPDLVEMMKDKREGREALAKAAAEQLGKIGHRDAIPALITELEEEDAAGPNDAKMKARRANLNTTVQNTLKKITDQDFKLGSQARKWWNQNAETFQREKKAPPPDSGGDGSGGK